MQYKIGNSIRIIYFFEEFCNKLKKETSYIQRRIKVVQDIEEIYVEYFETVNKYLFCLTRNYDISEELTQETFYHAVKKIDTFKGNCKMSVWLCQIAKNLWYDECRKNKKYVQTNEEELFGMQDLKTIEEELIDKENKICYQTILKI